MAKFLALSSGGKDSILALHLASMEGLELEGIITMLPEDPESYLYHTRNVRLVEKIAESIGTSWRGVAAPKDREEEALLSALKEGKAEFLVVGGIASNYQKVRFEDAARRAGMRMLSPLWGWRADQVYGRLLELGMEVVVIAVAAYGLGEDWLGRRLDRESVEGLLARSTKYRFNPVGEGGDLDTFVLDGPLYRERLVVSKALKKWEGDRGFLEILELSEVGK